VTSREFRARLLSRARRAHVLVDGRLVEDLETYYRLLVTWNARINLTGLELSELTAAAIDRLLIEPVAAARHAPARTARVMDIGSGGGSPAIPFALAIGAVRLRMVESKTRKSVFLRETVRALGMPDAEVLTTRWEDMVARPEYRGQEDLVTIRAVRVDPGTLSALETLVRPGGRLFLFMASEQTTSPLSIPAGLLHVATVPLVDSLGSALTILERKRLGPG
jgi:16S rRNA (guanine527-N7)-methyltransferase